MVRPCSLVPFPGTYAGALQCEANCTANAKCKAWTFHLKRGDKQWRCCVKANLFGGCVTNPKEQIWSGLKSDDAAATADESNFSGDEAPLKAPTHCHRYRGTFNTPGGGNQQQHQGNSSTECEASCGSTASCYAWTFTPAMPQLIRSLSNKTCTIYAHSNIGKGQNLPHTPTSEASVGACCSLCEGNANCASWTFALSAPGDKTAPYWLHPKVGSPSSSGENICTGPAACSTLNVACLCPLFMHSSAILARVIGNQTLTAQCSAAAKAAGRDFQAALYSPERGFFAYGAQIDGSGRADDVMFSGMLAGAML